MRDFLVTVKLPKNPEHDPQDKKAGVCPFNPDRWCTDTTGEHHTTLFEDGGSVEDVRSYWVRAGYHVTRVEEV